MRLRPKRKSGGDVAKMKNRTLFRFLIAFLTVASACLAAVITTVLVTTGR
jgi:hypothetical protein